MSVRKCDRRSLDLLEKINTIKKTCAAQEEEQQDITWSSSSEDSKYLPPKTKSAVSSEEKVQKWIKSNLNQCEEIPNRSRIIKKSYGKRKLARKQSEKVDKFEVVSKQMKQSSPINNENCASVSPIITRNKRNVSKNDCSNPVLRHFNDNSTLNELLNACSDEDSVKSPVLKSKRRPKFTEAKHKTVDLNTNKSDNLNLERGNSEPMGESPILKTRIFNKKIRLELNEMVEIENISADIKMAAKEVKDGVRKNLFPDTNHLKSIDRELSQVSIDFSNSPILKNTQISDLNPKISCESSSQNEISDHSRVISLLSTPIKSKSAISAESIDNAVAFDSAFKKRKRKLVPGGVASRLQKLLKKQKSVLSVGRHETYLATCSNFELPALNDKISLKLQVINVLQEFGKIIVRCRSVEGDILSLIVNDYFVKQFEFIDDCMIRISQPYSLLKMLNPYNVIETFVVNVCNIDVLTN